MNYEKNDFGFAFILHCCGESKSILALPKCNCRERNILVVLLSNVAAVSLNVVLGLK